MASVALRGISKRFGAAVAIDGVDLSVAPGEFVTLLGPSGCGKTTLLRVIAGLTLPDAGSVHIDDADITRVEPFARDLGMVFQSPALFPHMSAAQNVAFGLRMRNVALPERDDRVREALELMQMAGFGERLPRQLSGGQQQRIAIARALVIKPRVLLMDEPFSALDRKLRESMQVELRELTRKLAITVIFVTHDQEEALVLSDRIAVMRDGRIAQVGTPVELFERPRTRFVADFMGFGNLFEAKVIESGPSGSVVELGQTRVAVPARLPVGAPAALALRAERIGITRAGSGAGQAHGHITRVVYQGGVSAISVRLDQVENREWLVRTAERGFAPGEHVTLTWRDEDVCVLADDV